jgi:hypothetical protein
MTCVELPHSGISGSTPVSGFPELIAACYALHRPLTPRNPPYALIRLTKIKTQLLYLRYSNVKERLPRRANSKIFSNAIFYSVFGGGERARTDDLLRARQALSQLSYTPINFIERPHQGPKLQK